MKKIFENLVQDFCKLCALPDAASIGSGAPIDVGGINFSLAYSEDTAPDRVMIFCDYGPVPSGRETQIYRALLEANLFVYDTDSAVFSLSPQEGNVICAARFALESLHAEDLRAALTRMSHMAKDWREHYLDPRMPMKAIVRNETNLAGKLAAQFQASKQ